MSKDEVGMRSGLGGGREVGSTILPSLPEIVLVYAFFPPINYYKEAKFIANRYEAVVF